jgi:predicted nucleic acid-binding protein
LIVIDASIAVKWIVNEPDSSLALLVRDLSVPLIAPDLMLAEFANVMRRNLRKGEVTSEQVDAGVALIKSLIDEFVPTAVIIESALELSRELDHSPYDCMYLACAIHRGFLLTADTVFLSKVKTSKYSNNVISLDDLQNGRATAVLGPALTKGQLKEIQRLLRAAQEVMLNARKLVQTQVGDFFGHPIFEIPEGATQPAIDAPARLRLKRYIENLTDGERLSLMEICSFGRSGRHNYLAHDWISYSAKSEELEKSITVGFDDLIPVLHFLHDGIENLEKLANPSKEK